MSSQLCLASLYFLWSSCNINGSWGTESSSFVIFLQPHPYISLLYFFGAGLLGVAGNGPASHEEAAAL